MKQQQTLFGRITDEIEETLIAVILGLMTLITFANVVVRYVFEGNILWALEVTVFLFAWLVLLGMSYGVKHSLHIGVDVLLNVFNKTIRKILTIIAALCCLGFSLLLLKGSWDYWYPFVTTQAFYETEDVPMPEFLQFLSTWLNDGERYEKIPKFIPYFILPLSSFLLTVRFIQAFIGILTGSRDQLIASHEAEELLEAVEKENSSDTTVTAGQEK